MTEETTNLGHPQRAGKVPLWGWLVGGFIVLFFAFVAWADHYQPLAVGQYSYEWPGSDVAGTSISPDRYATDAAELKTTYVNYPQTVGYQFGFQNNFVNGGPFPVTITAISTGYDIGPPFSEFTEQPIAGPWSPRQPDLKVTGNFRATTVGPGQSKEAFGAVVTYIGCPAWAHPLPLDSMSGSVTLPTYKVTYSFLGFVHTIDMRYSQPSATTAMHLCDPLNPPAGWKASESR